jgi:DNA-binding NarL/FixJ family response regulator
MRINSVYIATSAVSLAEMLGEVLRELDVRSVMVSDGDGLLTRIKAGFPRFVLLENCFREQVTVEFIKQLTGRYSELRVVVWSAMPVKANQAAQYIWAGAESFFSIRGDDRDINEILGKIIRGIHYCPLEVKNAIENEIYEPLNDLKLTRREKEVVKLTICGWSRKEIAAIIGVKPCTVKMHKLKIYRKLAIKNTVEMVCYGLINDIVSVEELKKG